VLVNICRSSLIKDVKKD